MTRRWNASDVHYDLTAVRDRPTDIPIRLDARWMVLATYAVERMTAARQNISNQDRPERVRRRLCHFWGDLSRHVVASGYHELVLTMLDSLADYEYRAAGCWFDGVWHRNGIVMARLLWHMQCPDHLVSAALDLHRRVQARSTAEEETSRGGGKFLLSFL